jgi:branched-chain amino acid transport system permease protein
MAELIQHIVNAVSLGGLYALYALGIALLFGTMRLVNFAQGEFIMVGAYGTILLNGHVPSPILVLATIGIVVVFALLTERIAFRPVRDADPATLMVTSFAVSYILQNLAVVIFGALPRTTNLSTSLAEAVQIGGVSVPKLNIVTIVTVAILLAALSLFLKRTPIGVQMRAAAENFRMARLVGVKANWVIATAFAISGVLAAVASLLFVAQTGTVWPYLGITPLVVAFFATVLGGLGSLRGAVLGAFILSAFNEIFQAGLPSGLKPFREAFVYGLVVILLLIRPQGLLVPSSARTRV